MILLDTQVLVWSSLGDARLGDSSRGRMIAAMLEDDVVMSPISAWEIAMLVDKGRLEIDLPVQDWIANAAAAHGVRWMELSPTIAASAGQLPGEIHGDPADRLIVASARAQSCPVMTADRAILRYAATGHVQAIDARR